MHLSALLSTRIEAVRHSPARPSASGESPSKRPRLGLNSYSESPIASRASPALTPLPSGHARGEDVEEEEDTADAAADEHGSQQQQQQHEIIRDPMAGGGGTGRLTAMYEAAVRQEKMHALALMQRPAQEQGQCVDCILCCRGVSAMDMAAPGSTYVLALMHEYMKENWMVKPDLVVIAEVPRIYERHYRAPRLARGLPTPEFTAADMLRHMSNSMNPAVIRKECLSMMRQITLVGVQSLRDKEGEMSLRAMGEARRNVLALHQLNEAWDKRVDAAHGDLRLDPAKIAALVARQPLESLIVGTTDALGGATAANAHNGQARRPAFGAASTLPALFADDDDMDDGGGGNTNNPPLNSDGRQ